MANKPFGTLRSWLATENHILVLWTKGRILRVMPDVSQQEQELLHEILEDTYLRAIQQFDLTRGIMITTYVVAAMRMSGYRDWMRKITRERQFQALCRSLDWEDESLNLNHGTSPLETARSADSTTVFAHTDTLDLRRKLRDYLTRKEYLAIWMAARGVSQLKIMTKLGVGKGSIQQIFRRAREKILAVKERLGIEGGYNTSTQVAC